MISASALKSPCFSCPFRGELSPSCEFEFFKKWLSPDRLPRDCSRNLKPWNHRNKFHELAILEILEHDGRKTEGALAKEIALTPRETHLILLSLRRRGMVVRCFNGRTGKLWKAKNRWGIFFD